MPILLDFARTLTLVNGCLLEVIWDFFHKKWGLAMLPRLQCTGYHRGTPTTDQQRIFDLLLGHSTLFRQPDGTLLKSHIDAKLSADT